MTDLTPTTNTTWTLANMAGCSGPDRHDGAGFDHEVGPDPFTAAIGLVADLAALNGDTTPGDRITVAGEVVDLLTSVAERHPTGASPGAEFLRSVEDGVREALTYHGWPDYDGENVGESFGDGEDVADALHEIADGAPSVYTFPMWQQFTDLGAWSEDLSEYGDPHGDHDGGGTDLESLARVALFQIARRLADAVLSDLCENRPPCPICGEGFTEDHDTYPSPDGTQEAYALFPDAVVHKACAGATEEVTGR